MAYSTCTLWTHMVGICQCTLHIGKIFCLNMAFLDNYLCEYILYLGTHLYIVAVSHNFNIFAPLPPSNIYKSFWNRNSHLQSGPYLSLTGVFMMGYWSLFGCLIIVWATVAYSAALLKYGLLLPIRLPYVMMSYSRQIGSLIKKWLLWPIQRTYSCRWTIV